jgi:hypothetical protein
LPAWPGAAFGLGSFGRRVGQSCPHGPEQAHDLPEFLRRHRLDVTLQIIPRDRGKARPDLPQWAAERTKKRRTNA